MEPRNRGGIQLDRPPRCFSCCPRVFRPEAHLRQRNLYAQLDNLSAVHREQGNAPVRHRERHQPVELDSLRR